MTLHTTDPQSELLDVVDESDLVIESKTRAEIHRLNLRHRACHIVVFDSQGRVCLQKRSMTKDNSPGLWDTACAGHVDSGETYIDCATRELAEELGLQVTAEQLQARFKLEASAQTEMEFSQVYTLVTDDPMDPDPIEIEKVEWCRPAELDRRIAASPADFTPVFKAIWAKLGALDTSN